MAGFLFNMNYSDLLKSPKWQKKRLEILHFYDFQCRVCYDRESELHVHHKYYTKGKKPWEYDDDCYVVLCDKCHKNVHEEYGYLYDDIFVNWFKKSGKKYYTFYIFTKVFKKFIFNSSDKQVEEISKIIESQTIKREEF